MGSVDESGGEEGTKGRREARGGKGVESELTWPSTWSRCDQYCALKSDEDMACMSQ